MTALSDAIRRSMTLAGDEGATDAAKMAAHLAVRSAASDVETQLEM